LLEFEYEIHPMKEKAVDLDGKQKEGGLNLNQYEEEIHQ